MEAKPSIRPVRQGLSRRVLAPQMNGQATKELRVERKVPQDKRPATTWGRPEIMGSGWPGRSGAVHERITQVEARKQVAYLVHRDCSFCRVDGLGSTIG